MKKNRCPVNPSMTKKLYQLVISRLDGDRINNSAYRKTIFRLIRNGIGGFILFGGRRDAVKQFTGELQKVSEIPLFIASDIERGTGQQVSGSTIFPCQMAVAAAIDRTRADDLHLLEEAIVAIAREASYVGINMPLIPVLDVNQDPDNPIICTRAFSDDPEVVSWFGSHYIRILEQSGLVSCAKHFPGHGDTSVDSHLWLPVIQKSYEALKNTDIKPFRDSIMQGVSSIMVGHLSVPAIDVLPSSLSQEIYRLLRDDLQFTGLILTDALTMSALHGLPDPAVRCLRAGADILLHPADPDETVNSLMSAMVAGNLAEDRVEDAYARVLSRKARLSPGVQGNVDFKSHAILSARLSEKSVSLVKRGSGKVPLAKDEKVQVFIAGDQEPSSLNFLRTLSPDIRKCSDHADIGGVTAVVAIFSTVSAWKGSAGIADDQREKIRTIAGSFPKSIIISFGNPYILRYFGEADVLVAAFEGSGHAQKTVAEWLRGSRELEGGIPVRLI